MSRFCSPIGRREALFLHRVAAGLAVALGQVDAQGASMPVSVPPAPPNDEGPAPRGRAGRAGGEPIDFIDAGGRGESPKPVDSVVCNPVTPYFSKASARFATFGIPRVGLFSPRVGLFSPHRCFSVLRGVFFFFSLFIEREREERGGGQEEGPSTGWVSCNKTYPRVLRAFHGFSVDVFLGRNPVFMRVCGVFGVLSTHPRVDLPLWGVRLGFLGGRCDD